MWNIPPIIGQKVMLNPSYAHYNDFNRTQSKGYDGYILSVQGMDMPKWLLGVRRPTLTILWENGHENVYELDALLPIDSFKTIERVEFTSSTFMNVYNERTKDKVTERVIMKNDDIKHYSMFDKEKRLEVLNKAESTFHALNESDQNNEKVQMKYMSILEEIERTKRAEEVVLFLEHEGEDASVKPRKKHHQVLVASSEHSIIAQSAYNDAMDNLTDYLVDGSTVLAPRRGGVIDSDFFNPCVELIDVEEDARIMNEAICEFNELAENLRTPITTKNFNASHAQVYASLTPGVITEVYGNTGTGRSMINLDEPRQPLVENHLTISREQALEMGDWNAVASIDRLIRASQD